MSAKRLSAIADPTLPGYIQESLFAAPKTSYNPYPRLVSKAEDVREIMRRGAEEGKIGCDLEFNNNHPTIFGAACKDTAGAVRWDSSLAAECLELAEKSGAVIVGHSTIGAEKQQFEKELGVKTPVSIWGCSMIGHHLTNGHLTKMAGKAEEEDAGSLGLMGLSTVTSLETDLPAYKFHRGIDCQGPCPTCLRGESLVWLANGKKERIAKLVKDKYAGEVFCVTETGALTTAKVTGWHHNPRNGRDFYRVFYKDHVGKSGYNFGTVMTEDHPVLTDKGYVLAANLKETNMVNTGTPGFSTIQQKFIVGLLLGDSHIRKNGKLAICHGQEQIEYLDLKVRLLSQWKTTRHVAAATEVRKNWAATNEFEITPIWKHLEREWRNNWKNFVIENFTIQSLAIWYLDDGSYHRYQSSISVKSYTEEERDFLCEVIWGRTGIYTHHRDGAIIFPAESAKLLAAAISPYTPECLRYKLYPLKELLQDFDPTNYESGWVGETFYSPARIEKTRGRINWNNGREIDNNVYCLSVEKYENFATEAGIVHNCRVFDYCAIDAWGSLAAAYNQEAEMASLGIPHQFYRDCLELTDICMEMEKTGLRIDREWVKHMDKAGTESKNTLFPFELINKKPVYKEFNPKAAPQITEYFAGLGITLKDSTKGEVAKVLEKVARKEGITGETIKELCSELALAPELSNGLDVLYRLYQFKDAGKGVKSWFDDKYYGKDGRIHPRFITTGTCTGRLSSSRPNFQNLGARGWAKELKKAIIPDEGHDFVESDWSQLELRIILYLAGVDVSEIPLDAFEWLVSKSPGDFIKAGALMKMNVRDVAKSVVHGSNYLEGIQLKSGQELESLNIKKEIDCGARILYTKKYYPQLKKDWMFRGKFVTFTGSNLAERIFGNKTLESRVKANQLLEGVYFKNFFSIREWHMRVTDEAESGKVQASSGRVLKLYGSDEDDAKMASSFYGQGVGADHARSVILWRKRNEGLIPVLTVHDSVVQQIPKDWSDTKAKAVMASMQEETPLLPGFVNPGKIKRGANYGDIELI